MYHVTNRRNLRSIRREGLDPSYAQGKRRAVWLVTGSRVDWAIVHVLSKRRNRKCTIADMVVLEVRATRQRRYKRGVWYVTQVIDSARIVSVWDAKEEE